jgi:hypothetical protein
MATSFRPVLASGRICRDLLRAGTCRRAINRPVNILKEIRLTNSFYPFFT